MKEHKLAIVISHPVQYYSPLFKEMSKELDVKVFYCFNPNPEQQGKDGFGISFQWDVDLLEGYKYEFLENISKSPSSSLKSGCDTPYVGDALEQYGATHVVTFGWHLKSYLQTLKFCKRNSIPIAVRGDSQWDPNQPIIKKWIKKIYYPFFLNQFDAFLSVGQRNKAYLKRFGVKEEKIIFSPHAINQDFWRVERKQPLEKFRFIWVAKFVSKKRPLDTIRAFKKLLETQPNLKDELELQMVGTGPLLNQAKEEARKIEQVNFLGFKNQSELKSEYAKADCLLLTSDYGETWGLVVNEAFAAGLPAIGSAACGCCPDLINSSTGRTYPFGDIGKLTEVMEDFLLNFDQKKFKRAVASKNKIYSFDQVIGSFKQFLNLNA